MKEGTEEKNIVVISDDKDELGEFVWRIFSQSSIILRPHRSRPDMGKLRPAGQSRPVKPFILARRHLHKLKLPS